MRTSSSITGVRHLVAQRRLVEALVEPHAAGIVVVCLIVAGVGDVGVDVADVDRHILADVGQRHRRLDGAVAGDDDAQRLRRGRGPPASSARALSGLP